MKTLLEELFEDIPKIWIVKKRHNLQHKMKILLMETFRAEIGKKNLFRNNWIKFLYVTKKRFISKRCWKISFQKLSVDSAAVYQPKFAMRLQDIGDRFNSLLNEKSAKFNSGRKTKRCKNCKICIIVENFRFRGAGTPLLFSAPCTNY